ncbi:hypothetical protein GQ457_02G027770 [Hibiscus cannabinus]
MLATPQVLHECGIASTFVIGSEVPLEGGDLVSCMVVVVDLNIRKFGVTYESGDNITYEYGCLHSFTGDEDATRNIEMDLTQGLLSLESFGSVKVQICNYLEEPKLVASASPQVVYDYGIITSFNCLLNSTIILSTNDEYLASLEIVNETKGTKWTYSKHFMGIPETKNTLYWVISWVFRGDELQADDHISLRVLSDLPVLEFGVEIVNQMATQPLFISC